MLRSIKQYFVIALIASPIFSFSQDKSVKDTINSILKDTIARPGTNYNAVMFAHETALFIKQPLSWKGRNWAVLGGCVAATYLSMQLDNPVRKTTGNDPTAPEQQHFFNSVWVEGGRVYGEWFMIPGLAAAFGTYGIVTKKEKSKKIAIQLVQAGLFSEALTFFIKDVAGRARPYTNEGKNAYHWFEFGKSEWNAIPSGHTTSAWALSAVVAGTASSDLVKFLAYVPAGFTMFSRIYQDRHWFSDSVAGACIGYFVGNWVVNLHSEKKHEIKVTSFYPPGVSYTFN